MKHLLVAGCGYSGGRIADALLARGWRVSGTRRDAAGAEALRARGIQPVQFDGEAPSSPLAALLPSVTHLLLSIPPGPDGDPFLARHAADLRGAAALRWAGLLSTTGVYGDRGGAWVDESTPPAPGPPRAHRRLEAERAWHRWAEASGVALQIFRLSGIYGPGRSAFDRIRSGSARRIVKDGSVFNRIHVDDVVGAVVAGIERPHLSGPVNVSDDEPASSHRVLTWAAERLGVDPPPEVDYAAADLSPMARSFYEQEYRVSNRRLKAELGYALRHPTFREGLEAVLATENPGR